MKFLKLTDSDEDKFLVNLDQVISFGVSDKYPSYSAIYFVTKKLC